MEEIKPDVMVKQGLNIEMSGRYYRHRLEILSHEQSDVKNLIEDDHLHDHQLFKTVDRQLDSPKRSQE